MKTTIILFAAMLLIVACGKPQLDKATAVNILEAEKRYPRTVDYDL
ncbi:hypothetical protein ACS126_13070 [Sphingobacterium lactis]